MDGEYVLDQFLICKGLQCSHVTDKETDAQNGVVSYGHTGSAYRPRLQPTSLNEMLVKFP